MSQNGAHIWTIRFSLLAAFAALFLEYNYAFFMFILLGLFEFVTYHIFDKHGNYKGLKKNIN